MQLVIIFNKGEIYIPEEIKEKSIGVDGNHGSVKGNPSKVVKDSNCEIGE